MEGAPTNVIAPAPCHVIACHARHAAPCHATPLHHMVAVGSGYAACPLILASLSVGRGPRLARGRRQDILFERVRARRGRDSGMDCTWVFGMICSLLPGTEAAAPTEATGRRPKATSSCLSRLAPGNNPGNPKSQ